jgi:hypothetical protein
MGYSPCKIAKNDEKLMNVIHPKRIKINIKASCENGPKSMKTMGCSPLKMAKNDKKWIIYS